MGFEDSRLPKGTGYPYIWVEDLNDLPENVQALMKQPPTEDDDQE
jgi:hypothetical protein